LYVTFFPDKRFIFLIFLDTSKNDSVVAAHGGHGTFLSSLAALSILTLTSHHRAHQSHSTLILHHSRPAARLVPAPSRHYLSSREHGTRVHVQDLFGSMPVRVKQRALTCDGKKQEKQWERLSNQLVALILAWGFPVTFMLKNAESAKKILIRGRGDPPLIHLETGLCASSFDISIVRSVLSQAGYIEPSDWNKWIQTSVVTSTISIHGAISLQPAPSKQVQFITLGIRPFDFDLNRPIYDEVNQIFTSSDFGRVEDSPEPEESPRKRKTKRSDHTGFTTKQLKGGRKGADRWPMFSIRIDLLGGQKVRWKRDLEWERESALLGISCALEAMITGFLNDHHFRPHAKRPRLHGKSLYERPPSPRISPSKGSFPILLSNELESSLEKPELMAGPSKVTGLTHFTASEKSRTGAQRGIPRRTTYCQKSPRQNLHSRDSFSAWSRIKSGKRESVDELLTQGKQRPFREAETGIDLTSNHAKNPPIGSIRKAGMQKGNTLTGNTEANAILELETSSNVDARGTRDAENDHTLGETIEWINPISGATVLLNARTGLAMSRPRRQPPSMLPKLETMTSHSPNSGIGMPRLPHRLSDTFSNLNKGLWVSNFLKTWNNPVFKPCEEGIPVLSLQGQSRASSGSLDGRPHSCSDSTIQRAFTESSSLFATKLSKDALSRSTFIAQVDRKFLLIYLDLSPEKENVGSSRSHSQRYLVLIDQHAADERIRVERLLADLCQGPRLEASTVPTTIYSQSTIATMILPKPITFTIHHRESNLFETYASHFADWGILYSLEPPIDCKNAQFKGCRLTIRALPEAIAERCRADTKLLVDLLRTEVWRCKDVDLGLQISAEQPRLPSSPQRETSCGNDDEQEQTAQGWLRRVGSCPQGIIDMLNSRACRSAIMFNDVLTEEECKLLLGKLAKCAFPFQCAHGRPSMVPLVRLGEGNGLGIARGVLRTTGEQGRKDTESEFGGAWRRWIKEREKGGRMKVGVER
jgi:DNA mismatch repair protein MLH3